RVSRLLVCEALRPEPRAGEQSYLDGRGPPAGIVVDGTHEQRRAGMPSCVVLHPPPEASLARASPVQRGQLRKQVEVEPSTGRMRDEVTTVEFGARPRARVRQETRKPSTVAPLVRNTRATPHRD